MYLQKFLKLFTVLVFMLFSSFHIAHAASTNPKMLKLATSTSFKSSGLSKILLPMFERHSGLKVTFYSVGSGRALRMGRHGEVDVVLTHAPDAEVTFIKDGHGVLRKPVMHNNYIIAGPISDPANISSVSSAGEALKLIHKSQSLFISRGDDSGTHKTEMSIWETIGIQPFGDWYYEIGASSGVALDEANKKGGYSMMDNGTWLAKRNKLALKKYIDGGELLINAYSVIAVNPSKHNSVNYKGAEQFVNWITGEEARKVIKQLKVDGENLFQVGSNN